VRGPGRGPVGDVEQQVVVAAVAAENGKAQVVADLGLDAPAPPLHDHPLRSRGVTLVFAGHTEQVSLVVVLNTVGRGEQQAVVHALARAHGDTAGNGAVVPRRHGDHPLLALAARVLRIGQGIHGKAGGEHFRQQYQVRCRQVTREQLLELLPVVCRAFPGQLALHQGDFQIAHSRAAASFSTLSDLAKQKRNSC
jgi:hypothetical protein